MPVQCECVWQFPCRSAPPSGGMPAPGPGRAGAAAPAPGGDRLHSSGRPFRCSCPSRPLAEPNDNKSHLLRIAHANINSITAPNRLDELHHFVRSNDIHILALSETKLDDSVHPSLFRLDNFHAPITHHRNRHGGGTAIYAHKSLPITEVKCLELDSCEDWVWCKISFKKSSLLVCCLYLPPNMDSGRLEQFADNFFESITLSSAYPVTTKIILGDFNLGNNYLNQSYQSPKVVASHPLTTSSTVLPKLSDWHN